MLSTIIAIIIIATAVAAWTISEQRKLVMLDENISNAMSLIGAQLSSQFDAVMFILELAKGYNELESEALIDMVKSQRSIIIAKSTPDDVLRQEGIISEIMGRIAIVSEQYPEMKENQNYIKAMDAIQILENMVRTSRLVYNDSVAKLNREIRMFPVSMIAGALGFRQREYMAEQPLSSR